MIIYHGSTNVLTDDRLTYNNSTGERNTKVFKGTNAQMESLYAYYTNIGSTCELVAGNPAMLTVDVIGEAPEYSWDILTEAQSIDILDGTDSNVSATNAYLIRNYTTPSGSISAFPTFTGTSADISESRVVWLLSLMGQSERTIFNPVMRASYVVSNEYEITGSMSNVDVVYSTGTMISAEGVPYTMQDALPASGTDTRTETVGAVSVSLDYNIGWLKAYPQISYAGFGKIQVVTEYRYGQYAAAVYGAMI